MVLHGQAHHRSVRSRQWANRAWPPISSERYSFKTFKTRELIETLVAPARERRSLQNAGERLDRKTRGKWVAYALTRRLVDLHEDAEVVVDAVRIKQQISAIREAFGHRVVHVHLTAPIEVLAKRYAARPKLIQGGRDVTSNFVPRRQRRRWSD